VNIQDRIAKLETQICQSIDELTKLKEEVSLEKVDDSWKPRVGEIVLMSHHGNDWETMRFVAMRLGCYVAENGDFYDYCKPLNDPMVIQLIPHVPGDPKPYGDANNVIVVFKSGAYDASNPRDFNWGYDNDEADIVGWFDIT